MKKYGIMKNICKIFWPKEETGASIIWRNMRKGMVDWMHVIVYFSCLVSIHMMENQLDWQTVSLNKSAVWEMIMPFVLLLTVIRISNIIAKKSNKICHVSGYILGSCVGCLIFYIYMQPLHVITLENIFHVMTIVLLMYIVKLPINGLDLIKKEKVREKQGEEYINIEE